MTNFLYYQNTSNLQLSIKRSLLLPVHIALQVGNDLRTLIAH